MPRDCHSQYLLNKVRSGCFHTRTSHEAFAISATDESNFLVRPQKKKHNNNNNNKIGQVSF